MSKYNTLKIKEEKYQMLLESISLKNLSKVDFHHNIVKNINPPKFSILFNIIIFSYIFLLLPEKILSEVEHYIEITFNQEGTNQVISNNYRGPLPYINGIEVRRRLSGTNKYIEVVSTEDVIVLQWDSPLNDFSYMFQDLENITSVEMFNMFTGNVDLSYMFKNCINLVHFSYDIDINASFEFKDMKGMFYCCISLINANFYAFYYCYDGNDYTTCEINYNDIDMSDMFYNCEKLESVDFGDGDIQYISNMNSMFYNCASLTIIDLSKFKTKTDNYIDLSYMFYNCIKLTNVNGEFNSFHISDVTEIFYNCIELKSLSFSPKKTTTNIKMTKMFYNCRDINSIQLSVTEANIIPIDITEMFYNCITLQSLTIDKFKTDNVTNMTYMFYNCSNLQSLDLKDSIFSNTLITDIKGFFQNCESLISLDLTNFYTPNVEIMWDMFKGCKSLQTLIIDNFDTSKVTDMQSMFEGCSSLISLDLNHFNTSRVQYMNKMFKDCTSLKSLYFKNINSESLGTMQRMFYNCKSLEYLNIYSLIEDVQSINEIFEGSNDEFTICIKEEENIPNIYEILYKNKSIKRDCSTDCYGEGEERISAENDKKCCRYVKYLDKCYDKCPSRTKLSSTNIKECIDFNCSYPYFYKYEQDDCYDTDAIPEGYYINDTDLRTIDLCDDNCKTCMNNATYCTSCKDDIPYLYLHKCYNSCPYGYYNDTNGIKKCKCEIEKCLKCSEESLELDLCEICNEGYFKKSNEIIANNFVNCYKAPLENYYFDSNVFKQCYHSCKYCYKDGDKQYHFCTSCNLKNNYPIQIVDYDNNITYLNCYRNCTYNYIIDDAYNHICLTTPGCPPQSKLLIKNTKQCVSSCKETKYKYEFRNTCFETCPPESTNFSNSTGDYCKSSCPSEMPFELVEKQICVSSCTIMERYYKLCITNYKGNKTDEIQDMILSDIQSHISNTFDYTLITKDQNLVIEEDNIIYEITSTNTKYHDPKISVINLGECEPVLKKYYGIGKNESLYIFKVDVNINGKVKVEYELYYPFDKIYLRQLDISICDGIDISIGLPLNLSDSNLDLYDIDSPYYNDLCYPYTSENGTDITLGDRHNEYEQNDRNICQEDCSFNGIDENTRTTKCSCSVKSSISFISDIKIDKNKLYKFMNLKQIANFKVMKCYKLLFSKNGIKINIGFYSFIPTIIVYLLSLIIFYVKEFRQLKIQINEIVFAKKLLSYIQNKKGKNDTIFKTYIKQKKLKLLNINQNNNNINNKQNQNKENKINAKYVDNNDNNNDGVNNDNNIKHKRKNIFSSVEKNEKKTVSFNLTTNLFPPKKSNENLTNKKNNRNLIAQNNIEPIPGSKEHFFMMKDLINKNIKKESYMESQKIKLEKVLKYNYTELNNFAYKKAFKYDERNYLQYYFSLLKTKHILFQICSNNDYNSCWIKILLLFFNFASCYAVNALFFNDDTMHKIYEDGGDFNIIYQLPQIAYSTVISIIIDFIMNSLALTQEAILEIKSDKLLRNLAIRAEVIKEKIKIKTFVFFIINFLFILLFWYYLGCFCAVYKNTQFHLIKDTLISYGTGILIPLGLYLFPGILRILSLKSYTPRKRMIYNLSKFIQNFL